VSWLLKIMGAPPRKADRKNRIQVLISVLAVLLRTGYGLLRNSGPRVENTPVLESIVELRGFEPLRLPAKTACEMPFCPTWALLRGLSVSWAYAPTRYAT
jgi:hypothetical protein